MPLGKADETWGHKKRDLFSLFGHERRRVAPGLFEDIDRQWRQKYLKANVIFFLLKLTCSLDFLSTDKTLISSF